MAKVGDKFYHRGYNPIEFGIIEKIEGNKVYYDGGNKTTLDEVTIIDNVKNYYIVEICIPGGDRSYEVQRIVESDTPLDYVDICNKFDSEERRNIIKIEIARPVNLRR